MQYAITDIKNVVVTCSFFLANKTIKITTNKLIIPVITFIGIGKETEKKYSPCSLWYYFKYLVYSQLFVLNLTCIFFKFTAYARHSIWHAVEKYLPSPSPKFTYSLSTASAALRGAFARAGSILGGQKCFVDESGPPQGGWQWLYVNSVFNYIDICEWYFRTRSRRVCVLG